MKDTHLREILPFAEDFDPFLVEPVHKMTEQQKTEAFEHESVIQLFSFSPSYMFRLLKAKKNIIQLLSSSPSSSSVISESTVSPVNEKRDIFSSGISSTESKFKASLSSTSVDKDKSEINNRIYLGDEKKQFEN